jgi:hypothetical protein
MLGIGIMRIAGWVIFENIVKIIKFDDGQTATTYKTE